MAEKALTLMSPAVRKHWRSIVTNVVEEETKILASKKSGGNIWSFNRNASHTSNHIDKNIAKSVTSTLPDKDNKSSQNASTPTGNPIKGQSKGTDNATATQREGGAGDGR